MTRLDRFTGAILIVVAAFWTLEIVSLDMRDYSGWVAALFGSSAAFCGLLIIRSIWRDRL